MLRTNHHHLCRHLHPLLDVARIFLTSPTIDPQIHKPTSPSPLPEPSQFGSLGSFGNTDSGNTNALVAAPAGPINADEILNIVGLQQTVASYGNRQASMNNWMLGEILLVVAPNLPPPFFYLKLLIPSCQCLLLLFLLLSPLIKLHLQSEVEAELYPPPSFLVADKRGRNILKNLVPGVCLVCLCFYFFLSKNCNQSAICACINSCLV